GLDLVDIEGRRVVRAGRGEQQLHVVIGELADLEDSQNTAAQYDADHVRGHQRGPDDLAEAGLPSADRCRLSRQRLLLPGPPAGCFPVRRTPASLGEHANRTEDNGRMDAVGGGGQDAMETEPVELLRRWEACGAAPRGVARLARAVSG